MKYQFAPLEGLTTYIFRTAFAKYYGGIDEYFTPFISPHQNKTLNQREKNELEPRNNEGICVIPQILTNNATDFLNTVSEIQELGYRQVNLNFGCPSATVTTKKKGSGILQDLELLDRFLEEIFEKSDIEISIKTRIGFHDEEEWENIFRVYQKYPIKELIIHPRVRDDFYQNEPRMNIFSEAYHDKTFDLIYNGNLFSVSDLEKIEKDYPDISGMMIGRGLLACPNLLEEKNGQTQCDRKKLLAFHNDILEGYKRIQSGEKNVLFKMKELWFYLSKSFEDMPKLEKKLKKAQNCREYEAVAREIFQTVPFADKDKRKMSF